MRNEKNPDASRMVFPGMLDGVGINPMVAKRFGIQNESQLLDMASTGRELLWEYNDALVRAGIAMSRAEIKTKNRFTDIPDVLKIRDELVAEEECFSLKDLAVNGKDLMKELGLKPGKKIGAILQQMLEAVINETVTNNRDELLSLAQKLI